MLKMRLELLGDFEVLTAEDGEKGCAMAVSECPDIILMDLEMPVVDGWEATQRLKGNPQTRDIPIIALSAHALAGERDKALAAGCDEFDTKPIEFDRLVATLRRILARWRKRAATAPDRRRRFRVIEAALLLWHDLTADGYRRGDSDAPPAGSFAGGSCPRGGRATAQGGGRSQAANGA